MRTVLAACLGSCALVGCAPGITEIVIEVESDLAVPAEIDRLRIDASRPMGIVEAADADLAAAPLPRTLTLVHRGGELGPIEVDVIALRGETTVVSRRLRVWFEPEQRLRIVVRLASLCVATPCTPPSTCADGSCRAIDVASCEFEGRSCTDGGLGDARGDGRCGAEVCDGLDDDCDGMVDEGFDLMTSAMHCGRCGRACVPAGDHVIGAECVAGSCGLTCDVGFGDCDRDPVNGCESDLQTTMDHCGACGAFCPAAGTFHAVDAVCTAGRCLLSCDPDWGDCDDDRSTGCETHVSIDENNCGTCTNTCLSPLQCRNGVCI